jgi:selenocysteine lyase/cysteine desulfurase
LAALAPGEFDALAGINYMNAAASGPLPERSRAALDAFHRRRASGRLHDDDFEPTLARARAAAARLLNAGTDEIALAPNTSVGINLAADFLLQRRADGDDRPVIVVSDREFPANMYPWLELERMGFRVAIVPCDVLGRPDEARLMERLERDDVAFFALSAVQFATGWSADLTRLGELCTRRSILFAVDAIQAAGAVPLDPRASGIDVLATGGQKWLCAPWGTGCVWVRRDLITRFRPLHTGWLAYSTSSDFATLLGYDRDLYDDARRFEVGTLSFTDFLAFALSVELLTGIGVDRIAAHIAAVQQPLLAWAAADAHVTCLHDARHASGIVCVRVPHADAAFAALEQAGVVCAVREGVLRFAPHLYSTVEEMEQVVAILQRMTGA